MVGVNQAMVDSEPTPEFNQVCVDVVKDWEMGNLPFRDAIQALSGYLQEAIDTRHAANQGRAEHIMGYIQHYGGNLTTSIQHYERARALYLRVGNRDRVATVDLNQGENYRYKGDFSRARRLYRKAYETAAEVDNRLIQTMAIANQGLTYIAQEQYDKALVSLNEGRDLAFQWTDGFDKRERMLCEIYQGLAIVHLAKDHFDEAWQNALRALDIARKTDQPMDYGFANRIIGEVLTRMGDAPDPNFSSDPDYYFRHALTAFRDLDAEAELARTMFSQARSLAQRGRRTTAARKLQQVMIIFTQLGMLDDAARAAEAQLAVL